MYEYDVLLNEDFGREHIRELIQEADRERLANRLTKAQGANQWQTKVRTVLTKMLSTLIS